jgi:hypothetical protein
MLFLGVFIYHREALLATSRKENDLEKLVLMLIIQMY